MQSIRFRSFMIRGLAAAAAAPVLLGGCGSLMRQPANVEATRQDVEAIRREQTELKALVLELRTRLDGQSDALASMRADNNLELRQLTERLEILTARIEEMGARSDRRPSAPLPLVLPDTSRAAQVPGATGPAGNAAQVFEAAKRDFTRGNYQLAAAGFDEVIGSDPRGGLADQAQYWKGECYYSLGEVDHAIQEFLRVRDVYPESAMVAGATFKIGMAFLRKEDPATAKRYFETVVREYPGTPEASLAEDKLKSLR